jgi:FHS family L-fucose permease-like MFS transporter
MIGRWTGAINAFNLKESTAKLLGIVMPIFAFAVIILVNYIKGSPVMDLIYFFPFVLILIIISFIVKQKPAQTMFVFGSLAAIMMIIGIVTTGKISLYSFISAGLFCSVMWPCIFALSIAGLGKYTAQGSALLVMMIVGGATIPWMQGKLSESIGIHLSYIIPVLCFAYLAFFGWKVKQVLLKQGVNYDEPVNTSAH